MLEKRCGGISVCTRSLARVIASLVKNVLQGLYSQAGVHWTRQEYIYIYIYIYIFIAKYIFQYNQSTIQANPIN